MQKYKSNITSTTGAAIRNVPVTVLNEAGELASLFLDRAGGIAAPNPLATDSSGNFYFYAVNGRYSLRTTVDGVTITDNDVVLLQDPEEITVAGPIAEAVAAAQAAAQQAQEALDTSGISELVAAAQNAVVDAGQALQEARSASLAAGDAKLAAQQAQGAAEQAKGDALTASGTAGAAAQQADDAAQRAAQAAESIDLNPSIEDGEDDSLILHLNGVRNVLLPPSEGSSSGLMTSAQYWKLNDIDDAAKFAFGTWPLLPNANLNAWKDNGWTTCASVAIANTLVNKPAGFSAPFTMFTMVIGSSTSTRIRQEIFPYTGESNPGTWVRHMVTDIWTAWEFVLPSAQLLNRTYHTGLQTISTIAGLQIVLDNLATPADNAVINPHMDISWRGTSFSIAAYASATEIHTLDRWRVHKQSTATGTVSQVAGLATWRSPNCQQYTINTAQTALAADTFEMLEQPIEGIRIHDLIGTYCTFSARIYSSKVGKYTVRLFNPSANYFFQHEVEITTANTWALVTFPIPNGLAGELSWPVGSTGVGVRLGIVLAAGSSRRSTAQDAWTSGAALSGPNQVNFLDAVGNVFRVTDVNLFPGQAKIPPRRDMQTELDLCYRYLPVVDPETSPTYGSIAGNGYAYSTTQALVMVPFRVPPRTVPSGLLAYAMSNYFCTTPQGAPSNPGSIVVHPNIGKSLGVLLVTMGGATFSEGQATALFCKAKLFFQGCEL